jgi:hypothetical protein
MSLQCWGSCSLILAMLLAMRVSGFMGQSDRLTAKLPLGLL